LSSAGAWVGREVLGFVAALTGIAGGGF
jgi:hypothetical protein